MINALFGIKKGMTSSYDNRGRRVGATIVEIKPSSVTQIKNSETKDGYNGVQLGVGSRKSLRKPQLGHLKKVGIETPTRWMREVRAEDTSDLQPGQTITVDQVFSLGDTVKVTGTSKGRGFQGGVRRYGFHGGPKTHGQSDRHRAPGSVGSGTTPGRVLKGKRMAGHMGHATSSIKGLEIIALDKTNGLVTIKGGIPGPVGGLLKITHMGKVKGFVAPVEPEIEEEAVPSDVEQMEAVSEGVDRSEEPGESEAMEVVSESNDQVTESAAEEQAVESKEPEEESGQPVEEATEGEDK